MNESDIWKTLGRAMAEADSLSDIERAEFREAARAIGLCPTTFNWLGEEPPDDSLGAEEK